MSTWLLVVRDANTTFDLGYCFERSESFAWPALCSCNSQALMNEEQYENENSWLSTEAVTIFEEQRSLVSYFFDNFVHAQADRFIDLIAQCSGTIHFSGVGKSGFICSKMAASLASIGVKSAYLNPLDALHGDIGNLVYQDVLVLMSKSGSTEELVNLIPGARSKGAKLVSITCTHTNRISTMTDLHIHLPLERELCSFNLAPVTSTVLQLIFGDTVIAILMRRRNFSLEKFARNHPAGSIGRRLLLQVRDVMLTDLDVPKVEEQSSLGDAVLEMSRCGVGCAVVHADGTVKGIFTDGDLRRLIVAGRLNLEVPIAAFMTKSCRVVQHDTRLEEAKDLFTSPTLVSCLPVVSCSADSNLVLCGLLSLSQAIKALE